MSRSYASLSKYIGSMFPLSVKETDELKRRVRAAIKGVKAWESGAYSVSDFQEKMRIVKLAIDSHCSNWNAKDSTVLELLDSLVARLSSFKDSLAQEKRRETLLSWRTEMKVKSGSTPMTCGSTLVTNGSASTSNDSGVAASSRMMPNKVATSKRKQRKAKKSKKSSGSGALDGSQATLAASKATTEILSTPTAKKHKAA